MALDPISAGIEFATTIVKTIWPDKSAAEQAQLSAALVMVQGQLEINKAEASSPRLFVAGWRPFLGWVAGVACAWNWLGLSIAKFSFAAAGHPLELEPADLSEMWPLLATMLGLGAYRTVEKIKGVA